MTREEGLNKLIGFCEEEVKRSGFLGLYKKKLRFERSRLLKDYEKDANLPLPKNIIFDGVRIDFDAIKIDSTLYKWSDICASGIKTQTIDVSRYETIYESYLLFCLNNGNIIQAKLGDIAQFHGLLVHFIEQYKTGKV